MSESQILENLNLLHNNATSTTISNSLINAINDIQNSSAIFIGSGASYSTAVYASQLHELRTNHISKALTPLEFLQSKSPTNTGVVLLTSGGKNPDIRLTLREVVARNLPFLIVITTQNNTPIAQDSQRYPAIQLVELSAISPTDGFLAFYSLYLMSLRLLQAYFPKQQIPKSMHNLNPSLETINGSQIPDSQLTSYISNPYIISLHGLWSKMAAIDMESKFTEAALGVTLPADFRNFGHGRHFWLTKYQERTSVLGFADESTKLICNATLEQVPTNIPKLMMYSAFDGPLSALAHLIGTFSIVTKVGKLIGRNLIRPGVPLFGRKLYRMSVTSNYPNLQVNKRKNQILSDLAIKRKASVLSDNHETNFDWSSAYNNYIKLLIKGKFNGLVLDYDGTIVDSQHRFRPPLQIVGCLLSKIVEADVPVGIATGRGSSILESLRLVLPKSIWPKIHIGYYNGAVLGTLDEDDFCESTSIDTDDLEELHSFIIENPGNGKSYDIRKSKYQLSIDPIGGISLISIYQMIQAEREINSYLNTKILVSSHSIDIIPANVSKKSVLSNLSKTSGDTTFQPLCIGDKGQWPGNDWELLNCAISLSTDEVSPNPYNCWNLSPAFIKGANALLYYLSDSVPHDGILRLTFPRRHKL